MLAIILSNLKIASSFFSKCFSYRKTIKVTKTVYEGFFQMMLNEEDSKKNNDKEKNVLSSELMSKESQLTEKFVSTNELDLLVDTVILNVKDYTLTKEFYERVFSFNHFTSFELIDENKQIPPQKIALYLEENNNPNLMLVGCPWMDCNFSQTNFPKYTKILIAVPDLMNYQTILQKRQLPFKISKQSINFVEKNGIEIEIIEKANLTFPSQILGLQIATSNFLETKILLSTIFGFSEDDWIETANNTVKLQLKNAFLEFHESPQLEKKSIDPNTQFNIGINRVGISSPSFNQLVTQIQNHAPDIVKDLYEFIPGFQEIIFADYDQINYSVMNKNKPKMVVALGWKKFSTFFTKKPNIRFEIPKRDFD